MILYHGTTLSGLKAILSGNPTKVCRPWRVKTDNHMYFYGADRPEAWEDRYPPIDNPIDAAFTSAKIQSCYTNDNDVFVIECEVPDELVEDDMSVAVAETLYYQVLLSNFKPEFIKRTYHKHVNPYTKPEIVMGFYENGCANLSELPEDLLSYVEQVRFNNARSDTPTHILIQEFMQTIEYSEVSTAISQHGYLSYIPVQTSE